MKTESQSMSALERKAAFSLASVYFMRMFGLFLLLPVIVIYARALNGGTIFLAGLALGIYGLTQAIFQIPFGYLSDRVGRKKVIVLGLSIFAVGSIVAVFSDSIYGLIVGRALQGAGAISAAVLALNADLITAKQRTKAMALIGISIGAAFMLSLILAPILQHWIGVKGLFWLIFCLSIVAMLILIFVVPSPPETTTTMPSNLYSYRDLFKHIGNKDIAQLCFGIFTLHFLLTMLFVVLPEILVDNLGIALVDHWKFYIGILIASVIGMLPFIRANTKTHQQPNHLRLSFNLAIALLWVSLLTFQLAFSNSSLLVMVVAGILFFSAFNALESILPSLVSRVVSSNVRGTALGFYNTCQFLGIFIGGLLGGWLWQYYGLALIGFCLLVVCGIWVGLAVFMKPLNLQE